MTRSALFRGSPCSDCAAFLQALLLAPLSGDQHLCKAYILARKEEWSPALATARNALDVVHPESRDAEDARSLIAQIVGRPRPIEAADDRRSEARGHDLSE
jgi:hypothetical protein